MGWMSNHEDINTGTNEPDPLDDFGTNPFFTCVSGRDHRVKLFAGTRRTDKNDQGWKILRMDVQFEGNPIERDCEIPFWVRTGIVRLLNQCGRPDTLEILFLRTDTEEFRDGKTKTIRRGVVSAALSQSPKVSPVG